MINFFRKIRQQLVAENRSAGVASSFSKYMLYAIGEIILVVIGILIALQVNEWNKEYSRKKTEAAFITQLQSDLETSEKQLEGVKNYYLKTTKASARVSRAFWKTDISNDSIENYLLTPAAIFIYSPILGTARSLINSGNMDLLGSNELKREIVAYVEKVDYKLEDISRYEETYYRTAVQKLIELMPGPVQSKEYFNDLDESDSISKSFDEQEILGISDRPRDIDRVPFRTDLNQLFDNQEIFGIYKSFFIGHRGMYSKYDEILSLTSRMLERLNQDEDVRDEVIDRQ